MTDTWRVYLDKLSGAFRLNGHDLGWWFGRLVFVGLVGMVSALIAWATSDVLPSIDHSTSGGMIVFAVVQLLIELGRRFVRDNQAFLKDELTKP